MSASRPFCPAISSVGCQVVESLPNVFQRLMYWTVKMISLFFFFPLEFLISSQSLELVTKLRAKMALSNVGIVSRCLLSETVQLEVM